MITSPTVVVEVDTVSGEDPESIKEAIEQLCQMRLVMALLETWKYIQILSEYCNLRHTKGRKVNLLFIVSGIPKFVFLFATHSKVE